MDNREKIIHELEIKLVPIFDMETVTRISTLLRTLLLDYEVQERCTDVVIRDSTNDKILKRYCACLLIDGKSEKTIYQYRRSVQLLSDKLGKNFTDMGVYDIRYYLGCEKSRGISNVSLENTRANLSAFFQWLVNEELINKNPMITIKPIKCSKEIKLPFSDIEIDTMKNSCKTLRERALIELLLTSGIRVEELSHIKISDIDFDKLSVHVTHGKGNKERITYITSVSAQHIKTYIKHRGIDGEYLFYGQKCTPLLPGGIRIILKTLEKRAGITNVHPHRFRRTFATKLADRGMDIQNIQKLLGHSNLDTTLRYVHVSDSNVQVSYDKYML